MSKYWFKRDGRWDGGWDKCQNIGFERDDEMVDGRWERWDGL